MQSTTYNNNLIPGQDHASMGPTGQERPEEAPARPHSGDGAQGRARPVGAH